MNWLREQQVEWNTASRDKWELSSPHRRRVMALIEGSAKADRDSLCVLGAGNCNDLDLQRLAELFGSVHLVDLDGEALSAAVERQGVAGEPSIAIQGGVDLAGVCDELAKFTPSQPPGDADVERIITAAISNTAPVGPDIFDVVVSTCLLSQLHNAVVKSIGETHPRFLEMLLAVRHGHLRLLTCLVRPGGRGVLVSDFTSSDTTPELPTVPPAELPELLGRVLKQGNFFHGVNPFMLASLFQRDPVIAPLVSDVRLSRPWRWNFGPRVYAVAAIDFERK